MTEKGQCEERIRKDYNKTRAENKTQKKEG